MKTPHLTSALALGAAILTLSVGGAFAAVTTDNAVNVMAGPGQNFKTVARLAADTNVSISRMSNSWCRITATGATGWVSCADLNGVPARTNNVATVNPSVDYESDPVLGPTVPGGMHTLYNGEYH